MKNAQRDQPKLPLSLTAQSDLSADLLRQQRRSGDDNNTGPERQLAQDLHDHAGQFIAALYLRLNMLDRHVRSHEGHTQIEKIRCDLHRLGHELKLVALMGRPTILERAGLAEAIAALLDHWAEVAGFAVEFYCNRPNIRLDPAVELTLYRVTQEALTNVVKHAIDSPAVSVSLQLDASNWKYLKIEDHGPGFNLEDEKLGIDVGRLGLVGMQQRLQSIDANLEVVSARGFGTTVLAWRGSAPTIRRQYPARPTLPVPEYTGAGNSRGGQRTAGTY
jgi:signal transduction histidine kinase